MVPVVENPRRRRRVTKRRRAVRRRRRNPSALATISNPRRRRRASSAYYRPSRRRRYSRRRNPGLLGVSFDFPSILWIGAGMFGSKTGPALISKMIPLPTSGVAGYAVRAGSAVLFSMGVKMLTGSKQNADRVMAGGLGAIAYDLFNEYMAPMVGLSGYEGSQSIVIPADIQEALEGYTVDRPGVGRYIDQAETVATVY